MNSNLSVEKLFTLRNISELGTDVIEIFFCGISVKEVLKLCRTNMRFAEACKREPFWKNKVLLDYGVEKKYCNSWKETAILLFNADMINLRKEWIDQITYGVLLEESLKNDRGFFINILRKHDILPSKVYVYPEIDEDLENVYPEFVKGLENIPIEHLSAHFGYTIDDLKVAGMGPGDVMLLHRILKVVTREFSVIMHAVDEMKGHYNLFSSGQEWEHNMNELTDNEIQVANRIKLLVDPIPYVMRYSLLSIYNLNAIEL